MGLSFFRTDPRARETEEKCFPFSFRAHSSISISCSSRMNGGVIFSSLAILPTHTNCFCLLFCLFVFSLDALRPPLPFSFHRGILPHNHFCSLAITFKFDPVPLPRLDLAFVWVPFSFPSIFSPMFSPKQIHTRRPSLCCWKLFIIIISPILSI